MLTREALILTRVVMSLVALVLAVPASAAAQKKCDPLPKEFLAFGQTYRDCAVDRQAIAPPLLPQLDTAGYRPSASRTAVCDKVSIDVIVATTGRPIVESARIIRSTNRRLAEAAMKSLPELLYTPAVKDSVPVQQLARYERVISNERPIVYVNGVRQTPPASPTMENTKVQC